MDMDMTKEERLEMKKLGVDIALFLRMAALRIEKKPEVVPVKSQYAHATIGWLRALADRYGNGEDITE